eukprot:5277363-Prymnesium_polylepis.1
MASETPHRHMAPNRIQKDCHGSCPLPSPVPFDALAVPLVVEFAAPDAPPPPSAEALSTPYITAKAVAAMATGTTKPAHRRIFAFPALRSLDVAGVDVALAHQLVQEGRQHRAVPDVVRDADDQRVDPDAHDVVVAVAERSKRKVFGALRREQGRREAVGHRGELLRVHVYRAGDDACE